MIQVFLQPGSFPLLLHLVLSRGADSPKSISISTNYTEPKQSLDKCTGYLKLPSSPQVPYLNRCLNCRCRVCVLSRGIYIWEFKVVSGFFTLNRNFKLINTSKKFPSTQVCPFRLTRVKPKTRQKIHNFDDLLLSCFPSPKRNTCSVSPNKYKLSWLEICVTTDLLVDCSGVARVR